MYPDSARAWDSLAFAYRHTGNTDKAIGNYRNALKRDPAFSSALRALAELEAE
ncbi:MAG: tetratricopeptide repeat protein [Lysobacterales bacterium]